MRGGSLVRTRLSVRVKGSFPGSFVNVDRRGDTTLSKLRQTEVLFKVGTSSYNWSTIGPACVGVAPLGLELGSAQPLLWFYPGPMGDP